MDGACRRNVNFCWIKMKDVYYTYFRNISKFENFPVGHSSFSFHLTATRKIVLFVTAEYIYIFLSQESINLFLSIANSSCSDDLLNIQRAPWAHSAQRSLRELSLHWKRALTSLLTFLDFIGYSTCVALWTTKKRWQMTFVSDLHIGHMYSWLDISGVYPPYIIPTRPL